eukprot:4842682-Pleurochrysis_carterae.AAC.1
MAAAFGRSERPDVHLIQSYSPAMAKLGSSRADVYCDCTLELNPLAVTVFVRSERTDPHLLPSNWLTKGPG